MKKQARSKRSSTPARPVVIPLEERAYCAGCRKVLSPWSSKKFPGDECVDIRIGWIIDSRREDRDLFPDGFRPNKNWGRMHFSCFLRATESQDQYLAELGIK